MGLFSTVWTRPGHPTFGQVIADPPSYQFSFHDGVGLAGDGTLIIPESYGLFDDILLIDPVTPANCVSSLVRVYDDVTSPPTLVFEWLPSKILPTTGKADFDVAVSGRGVKSILGYARTEAWDWDGSANFFPTFPDWIYGGRNLLGNPGFEESPCRPEVNEITVTATGGTFTLSDGTDTTSALAFNVAASTMENEIEADITAIDDVLVTGTGAVDDPYVIEFVTPCSLGSGLILNPTSLTGGTATLARTQFGALQPTPWTKSQTISDGTPVIHGDYDSFRVTTAEAHSGTFSLLIDPATIGRRYAGAQQVVNVDPGGRYQASVWVKTNSASQEYRFVVRGVDEDILLDVNGNPALLQQTLTSGVWTLFSIPDVEVGDNTRIILRIANINVSGNPAIFYVDDGAFNEGMAAAPIGQILEELHADATTDHAGRVVWEDEANPGTPYLTLDFGATLDSAGIPWVDPEISIKIWMRFSYFQVMDQFAQTWGYEWRIVPDDPELGTWLWQVYNPGGMQTDYSAAASPAIQGGSSDTRRSLQRFIPDGTNHLVEGLTRLTARVTNGGLDSALGRIETSRIDRELPSMVGVASAAAQDAANTLASGVQYQYTLVDPQSRPLVAYQLGDRLTVHDPPLVDDSARVADLEVSVSPTVTEYEVTLIVEEVTSP